MSRGPGHIERALRARIALSRRSLFHPTEQFTSDELLIWATRHKPPWSAAERRSVLRAMHRITDGQPGWSTHVGKGHVLVFRFDPLPGARRSKQDAQHHLKPVRQSRRTMPPLNLLASVEKIDPALDEVLRDRGPAVVMRMLEMFILRDTPSHRLPPRRRRSIALPGAQDAP
jgi:hypothetical protein